jgi:hypothetical protein
VNPQLIVCYEHIGWRSCSLLTNILFFLIPHNLSSGRNCNPWCWFSLSTPSKGEKSWVHLSAIRCLSSLNVLCYCSTNTHLLWSHILFPFFGLFSGWTTLVLKDCGTLRTTPPTLIVHYRGLKSKPPPYWALYILTSQWFLNLLQNHTARTLRLVCGFHHLLWTVSDQQWAP